MSGICASIAQPPRHPRQPSRFHLGGVNIAVELFGFVFGCYSGAANRTSKRPSMRYVHEVSSLFYVLLILLNFQTHLSCYHSTSHYYHYFSSFAKRRTERSMSSRLGFSTQSVNRSCSPLTLISALVSIIHPNPKMVLI